MIECAEALLMLLAPSYRELLTSLRRLGGTSAA